MSHEKKQLYKEMTIIKDETEGSESCGKEANERCLTLFMTPTARTLSSYFPHPA